MARLEAAKAELGGFRRVVKAVVRGLVLLSLAAVAGVGMLALALARDGLEALDVVVALVLLAAPAIVLLFAVGVRELVELPERLLRMPQRGAEHVDELTRIAAAARTGTWRRAPSLLWRLRGVVGSARGIAGITLPLRVLAPPFLALTLGAVAVSAALVLIGLISFLVLAVS